MASAAHIIRKQVYDLKVGSEAEGKAMHKKVQSLNIHYLLPAMNKVFDDLFNSEEVVVIDRLEIDIGTIGRQQPSEYWVNEISQKLRQQLANLKGRDTEAFTPKTLLRRTKWQQAADNLLFFLNHGSLPEDGIYQSLPALFNDLADGLEAIQKEVMVRRWNWPEPAILWKRLVANASPEQLAAMSIIFMPGLRLPEAKLLILALLKIYGSNLVLLADAIARFYLDHRLANKISPAEISQFVEHLKRSAIRQSGGKHHEEPSVLKVDRMPGEEEKELPDKADPLGNASNDGQQETLKNSDKAVRYLPVANAGLCLVAPYMQALLEQCGLVQHGKFTGRQHQEHAIFLLHFVSTGAESATEDQLVLPKLLAGWPQQMPCLNPWPISELEKSETDDLHRSIIGYWSVLKNTSPDGLRGSFLTRPGRLTREDDHYLLQVEQQSIDVLLDAIPWGFRNILLPWMDQRLVVEWY